MTRFLERTRHFTEELETNLIGVTVVVLAVDFMGAVIAGCPSLR